MSPQSSKTLLRVRANRSKSRDNTKNDSDSDNDRDRDKDKKDDDDDDDDSATVPRRRFRKRRRRSNSDPSSNRPLLSSSSRRRDRDGAHGTDRPSSSSPSRGGDEVELLPDRFDPLGRPVDPSSSSSRPRRGDNGGWTERKGDFEYRSPKPGGTQARGAWAVGGTDPDQVERMMQDVTNLIGDGPPKGVQGWLGLAGRLLGSGLLGGQGLPGLEGGEGSDEEGEGDGDRRRGGGGGRKEVGKIGYGGASSELSRDERGKGRRRVDDHEYNDDVDYDDEEGGTRRRRRRRRRELD